uniref:Uncharacterized protein n=1 Tax=viral metagenome TaxID=1070528 RepID=A0A6C0LBM9_9ZZZZ
MALLSNFNNRNDDLIELNRESFNKQPFSFNIPGGGKQSNIAINEELFNRKKISDDVISMSSGGSSRGSSSGGKKKYMKNIGNIYRNKDRIGRGSRIESESDSDESKKSSNRNKIKKIYDDNVSEASGASGGSDESDESSGSSVVSGGSEGSEGSEGSNGSNGSDEGGGGGSGGRNKNKFLSPKEIIKNEINEKREIIYQLDRMESKGFRIPFKFNMNSDIEEMRTEYNRIIREKELDGSIRFQQKMLMAFISGTEYINGRYDPFSIKLDGWSEQVNENINDYDDIFEELHYKYKATGKKMAPELRLFISLSGSAFMFHLTSRMFKEQPLPDVENVLRSNPELMKQFQNAAAKQYVMGNGAPQQMPQMSQNRGSSNDNMGLFNMVSNLFGSLNSDPVPSNMPAYAQNMNAQNRGMATQPNDKKQYEDIDNIIKNVHSKISIDDSDNNIETLSVSDEEITSIIEDTADIQILKGRGRPKKGTRTLNI